MSFNLKKTLQTEILEDLIKIYERRWYRNSNFRNKVNIKIDEKSYSKYFINEKLSDNTLKILEEKEFIFVEKMKYRDINNNFYLNLDKINEIYFYLNKTHPQVYFDKLISVFNKYSCEINDIKKDEFLNSYNEGRSIKSYLNEEYLDLIKVSYYISANEEDIYERNFSNKVFNDSKKLEAMRTQIISFFDNENILIEKGIIRNPTYLYIKGHGQIIINKQIIDLNIINTQVGLPSTVISKLEFNNIEDVYTIENLTTFNDFNKKGLIIYLGGFSNHHKIQLLSKLKNHTNNFYHFGDIDYGGFSILDHLITNLNINIKAYNMSITELKKYKTNLINISDNNYIVKLKTLLNKDNLKPHYETIKYMINNKVKLEQESVVNTSLDNKI